MCERVHFVQMKYKHDLDIAIQHNVSTHLLLFLMRSQTFFFLFLGPIMLMLNLESTESLL